MKKTRILLVDDHHLFREGLAKILDSHLNFEVVGEATNGLEALTAARKLNPDLILMDVSMPVCDGMKATQMIKEEFPGVKIVMLSVADDNELLFEAIRLGAQGYLLKSIRRQEMIDLLEGAMKGDAAITPTLAGRMLEEFRRLDHRLKEGSADKSNLLSKREKEVLTLVATGASNKEVAENLNLSIHTIKSHIKNILEKLHLSSRREAAAYARREGLIPPNN